MFSAPNPRKFMEIASIISLMGASCARRRRLVRSAIVGFCMLVLCASVATAENDIHSRSAIVIDASTDAILYGFNLNLKLPPASTTKLMTALVALEHLSPTDTTVVTENVESVFPTKVGFKAGERVTVETLLVAALIKSANDAAFALAEAAGGTEEHFVEMMNEKAATLGLANTHFINATGLPGEGQFITALDLAHLLRHAMDNQVIRDMVNSKVGHITTEKRGEISLSNTNKLLSYDESILGGKTGYTRAARHCLVFASHRGKTTIIAALLGDDSRGRLWLDAEKLSDKGFAVLAGTEEPCVYVSMEDRPIVQAAYKKSVHANHKASGKSRKRQRRKSQEKPARGKTA